MRRILKTVGLVTLTLSLLLVSKKAWADDEGLSLKAEGLAELLIVYGVRKQVKKAVENNEDSAAVSIRKSVAALEKETDGNKETLIIDAAQESPLEVLWNEKAEPPHRVVQVSKKIPAEYLKSPAFITSLFIREAVSSELREESAKNAAKAGVEAQAKFLKVAEKARPTRDERIHELLAAYDKGVESTEFKEQITRAEKSQYSPRKTEAADELEENIADLDKIVQELGVRLIDRGKPVRR